MEKLGDCSWAGLRLRVELTAEGWTYSVYDLGGKTIEENDCYRQCSLLIGARLISLAQTRYWIFALK
jgi:hypothetical protein